MDDSPVFAEKPMGGCLQEIPTGKESFWSCGIEMLRNKTGIHWLVRAGSVGTASPDLLEGTLCLLPMTAAASRKHRP
ncbi:hypothetical protein BN871_HQ_00030 [Paenibacillus sp. P22]|nr:hypothetical protein BN871_HQ_00030 [Paenibacillus sp. P22]